MSRIEFSPQALRPYPSLSSVLLNPSCPLSIASLISRGMAVNGSAGAPVHQWITCQAVLKLDDVEDGPLKQEISQYAGGTDQAFRRPSLDLPTTR